MFRTIEPTLCDDQKASLATVREILPKHFSRKSFGRNNGRKPLRSHTTVVCVTERVREGDVSSFAFDRVILYGRSNQNAFPGKIIKQVGEHDS